MLDLRSESESCTGPETGSQRPSHTTGGKLQVVVDVLGRKFVDAVFGGDGFGHLKQKGCCCFIRGVDDEERIDC